MCISSYLLITWFNRCAGHSWWQPSSEGHFCCGSCTCEYCVLRWSDLFPGSNVTRSLLCPLSLSSHPCRTRPVRLWVSPCVGEEPLPTIAPERNSVTDYTSHDPPLPQPPSLNCTLKPFKPYKCMLHVSETYSNAVFNCFLISCNICVKWFWQYTMLLCNKLFYAFIMPFDLFL